MSESMLYDGDGAASNQWQTQFALHGENHNASKPRTLSIKWQKNDIIVLHQTLFQFSTAQHHWEKAYMHGFSLKRDSRSYIKRSDLWALTKENISIYPPHNIDKEMIQLGA